MPPLSYFFPIVVDFLLEIAESMPKNSARNELGGEVGLAPSPPPGPPKTVGEGEGVDPHPSSSRTFPTLIRIPAPPPRPSGLPTPGSDPCPWRAMWLEGSLAPVRADIVGFVYGSVKGGITGSIPGVTGGSPRKGGNRCEWESEENSGGGCGEMKGTEGREGLGG